MQTKTLGEMSPLAVLRWVLAGGLLGVGLLFAAPASAQEDGQAVWKRGGCSNCHGQLAQGGGGGEEPAGPNIRRSRLDPDQLAEIIGCGRPGTDMPAHMAGAYTEFECYGMGLLAEYPERTVRSSADYSQAELAALVGFLVANAVGQSNITRESCEAFRGVDSPRCSSYR